MQLPTRNTPRWIIFLLDIILCTFSFWMAYLLRFEFSPPQNEVQLAITFFPLFIGIRGLSFLLGKTYAGIIRYASFADTIRIGAVLAVGSLIFILLNQGRFHFMDGVYFVPNTIIVIEFLISLILLSTFRIAVKQLYSELKTPGKSKTNVIIYGAGEAGVLTKGAVERDSGAKMNIVAFVDDDIKKQGKTLEGVPIVHSSKLEEFLSKSKIEQLIVSIADPKADNKKQLIEAALKYNVKILNIPPVKQWIKGQLSVMQLREISIDELLGRKAIELDQEHINKHITGKTVLVTGAAGSIGSELARQILHFNPKKLVLLDQAETPMFHLERELKVIDGKNCCEFVIGDIRKKERMERLFEHASPSLVFHAAAYKHVPLMEENPSEAILTNVLGTKILVDLAIKFKTDRFVFVSTDKAVNPTSVMGASKRAAEIYSQSRIETSETKFITTRFGNVLGSNGSVIPLFKEQIAKGGPLTVTHEDVTRYFMTIPEAVQLVLEASVIGKGGEVFVFDMGESIKIIDLARQMIKLSGLTEGKDIEISITGLRPGEKLYEELLMDEENNINTHHPKIMIAQVKEYQLEEVNEAISEIVELFEAQKNEAIVAKLKDLIPEYQSKNSEFSRLDH